MYGIFGFTFKMKLSTRPEKFLGDVETWDKAEEKLKIALEGFASKGGAAWEMNPGDGAFYGPKIDITISDALKRDHQCATIQLDFQLPQRFNLEYASADAGTKPAKSESTETPASAPQSTPVSSSNTPNNANDKPTPTAELSGNLASSDQLVAKPDATQASNTQPNTKPEINYIRELTPGCARPVMIHRAIYGSFERFIAILTEHFAGKWPFWLSPRQILVVPVMPAANDYVLEVQAIFREHGMHVDSDISGNTMQKKIRTGQLQQYNFIFGIFKFFFIFGPSLLLPFSFTLSGFLPSCYSFSALSTHRVLFIPFPLPIFCPFTVQPPLLLEIFTSTATHVQTCADLTNLFSNASVVGAQERDSRTINIRNRDDPSTQAKGDLIPINEAIEKLERLRSSRALVSSLQ